jgi:hypothetical protein
MSEIPTIFAFFGARHGRSLADRATGVAKKEIVRARNSRFVTLRDAYEMYEYMSQKNITPKEGECCHFIRTYHYIPNEIDTSLEIPNTGLEGTMSFHEVRSTGFVDVLECRKLACFCDGCLWQEGPCRYSKWQEPYVWRTIDKTLLVDDEGKAVVNEEFPVSYRPPKFARREIDDSEVGTICTNYHERLAEVVEADSMRLLFDDDIPTCPLNLLRTDLLEVERGELFRLVDGLTVRVGRQTDEEISERFSDVFSSSDSE